jgi:two-component system clock-associated histidine kinase SasA
LLLFIDDRPNSQEMIRQIQEYLQVVESLSPSELQVIEISQQPHLVEHFRLVATPALVKISPGTRHTLAGSDIVGQLKKCWVRWQEAIPYQINPQNLEPETDPRLGVHPSVELLRISDEVFRLEKEKEALQEQLQFKDQILAMLAHDLRSPLTAASIALETLELTYSQKENPRSGQIREQLYHQARKQFRIMNRLIADILQASKNLNTNFAPEHGYLYLQSLCLEILEQYWDRVEDKQLTLDVDLPQDLPQVYADEELIRQVLVNLLDNAVKYTPEGGKISLSILHRTMQKIQISICDTGHGIPEAKKERIFESHVRLQRDEGAEGYGLGLSVCHKIITAHYGQIWVDSVPGQGSCFHFTLPIYR